MYIPQRVPLSCVKLGVLYKNLTVLKFRGNWEYTNKFTVLSSFIFAFTNSAKLTFLLNIHV